MMKKRITTAVLVLALLILSVPAAAAENPAVKLYYNGEEQKNMAVKIVNGASYLPLRDIGRLFQTEVGWDSAAKRAYIVKSGEKKFVKGTIVSQGKTYLKLTEVGTTFGVQVQWNGQDRSITIASSPRHPESRLVIERNINRSPKKEAPFPIGTIYKDSWRTFTVTDVQRTAVTDHTGIPGALEKIEVTVQYTSSEATEFDSIRYQFLVSNVRTDWEEGGSYTIENVEPNKVYEFKLTGYTTKERPVDVVSLGGSDWKEFWTLDPEYTNEDYEVKKQGRTFVGDAKKPADGLRIGEAYENDQITVKIDNFNIRPMTEQEKKGRNDEKLVQTIAHYDIVITLKTPLTKDPDTGKYIDFPYDARINYHYVTSSNELNDFYNKANAAYRFNVLERVSRDDPHVLKKGAFYMNRTDLEYYGIILSCPDFGMEPTYFSFEN